MPCRLLPPFRLWLLLPALLLSAMPAHAIPPPDVLVSVWQSVLQFLGMAAVFLAGTVFALRQWVAHYLGRRFWPVLLGLLLLGVVLFGAYLLMARDARAAETGLIQGERVPIEAVIRREPDDWVRKWKLQFLQEMKQDAERTRQRKQLPKGSYQVMESFRPTALQQLLRTRAGELYLLDIREAYERSRFSIPYQASTRYGDLVQGIMPARLPGDKMIVVLCHSGLRGYMGANFLRQAGFTRVAYLQGGLAQWHQEKLPVHGQAEYAMGHYPQPDKAAARAMQTYKVQLDADGTPAVKLAGLVQIPYETASSADLKPVFEAAKRTPVLLACRTYGGCFHAINLAWEIRQKGGRLAGIYDESGEQMSRFR
ncbi:MAG: rhodanese-like domain-containing protein [Thiothrix sp.]|nr:rhodanese-like domain-containing protein [Thiothrix sp.]HPE58921.1 rhodanese-like domain-containing protein [Thiolinea sp.]